MAGDAAIACDEVAALELGRPEIGDELEPVVFEKRRDSSFVDSEDARLAEILHPLSRLPAAVVIAAAVREALVVIVEHKRTAWGRGGSHERKHLPDRLRRQVKRNARPDEERPELRVITGRGERRCEILLLEIHGEVAHVLGELAEHAYDPLLLQRGRYRVVHLEDTDRDELLG